MRISAAATFDMSALERFVRGAPRVPRHVSLEMPELAASETTEWESRLNRLASECGCSEGATAMLSTQLVCISLALLRYPPGWTWLARALAFVAVSALAAMLGKAAGKARARRLFRGAARDLLALLTARERSGAVADASIMLD